MLDGPVMSEKKIFRQTLDEGKSVEVPVIVEYWWIDGKLEEVFPPEAQKKIDAAIRAADPTWFHTCYENPKQHCRACARKLAKRLTKRK